MASAKKKIRVPVQLDPVNGTWVGEHGKYRSEHGSSPVAAARKVARTYAKDKGVEVDHELDFEVPTPYAKKVSKLGTLAKEVAEHRQALQAAIPELNQLQGELMRDFVDDLHMQPTAASTILEINQAYALKLLEDARTLRRQQVEGTVLALVEEKGQTAGQAATSLGLPAAAGAELLKRAKARRKQQGSAHSVTKKKRGRPGEALSGRQTRT